MIFAQGISPCGRLPIRPEAMIFHVRFRSNNELAAAAGGKVI